MEAVPLPLDSLFVGRPSTSSLQLRRGSRRGHSSVNSRPGTATVQLPRKQLDNKFEDVGIPRASSVPLLSNNHVNLEVHSTPVSLATRSLSNHSATSVASGSVLRPNSSSLHSMRGSQQRHSSRPHTSAGSLHTRPPSKRPSYSTSANTVSMEGEDYHHKSKSSRSSATRRRNIAAQFGGGSVRKGPLERPPIRVSSTSAGQGIVERRSEAGQGTVERRSEAGQGTVERRSEAGQGTVERRSEAGQGTVERRSEAGQGTVERRSEAGQGTVERRSEAVNDGWLEQKVTIAANCVSVTQRGEEEFAPLVQGSLESGSVGVGGKEGKKEIDGGKGKEGEGERGRGEKVEGMGKRSEKEEGGEEREGEGRKREAAAQKIQGWYRSCHHKTQQAHSAEVLSLLQEKREELNHSLREQHRKSRQEEASREQEEERKRQRRLEKMRATRQAAIESLHQRREEKRRQGEKIAQEEIVLLQASGKIKRQGDQLKKRRKKERVGGEGRTATISSTEQPDSEQLAVEDPSSQMVPDSVITEFFEAGSSRKHLSKSTSQAPPEPSMSPSPHPSHTLPKAASTYTDIIDTLKLLEEAPPPLPGSKSGETLPTNYRNEMGVVRGGAKQGTASSSLSESKLQSILSYLDEMERADSQLVTQLSQARGQARGVAPPRREALGHTASGLTGNNEGGSGLGGELEAATAVATDVTTTILAQRMELDNKNKTVEMLQKALSQQRELTVYHAKEMEKEGQRRLELQKQEYETTIQRHQCFIDQLIEDKKTLGERCEQLVRELKQTSTKYQTKLKTTEETHAAELSKVRQVAAAVDKLRREKWRSEESQRIKEATVRSLEPEIQRIIAKGKADIQRLKTLHEAELLQADERAGRRFVAQMEELRAQCAAEKEQACAHERELARQRYEKLAEQEEMNAQQQRRRLFAELQVERDKMAAQWDQQRREMDEQQAEAQEAHSREMEEARREHARALEEVERRHGSQLRAVEERLATERAAWQENFTRRQETTFLAREREMRESLRQERDKEIEMVISRLEEEAENTRSQNEKAADARIKRMREKCEVELSEVERSERGTQEKLTTAKRELGEREGEVARLRSLLQQKEEEVHQVGEVAAKLSKERDNVTDVVRQEFADRLVSTEEDNRRLKIEMSELRARHRLELERSQREKERELEEVHSRVRQALVKKEENLSSLHSQHEAALKRADHLEMLLERQRRELLKK